jgi:hypothetical protein
MRRYLVVRWAADAEEAWVINGWPGIVDVPAHGVANLLGQR